MAKLKRDKYYSDNKNWEIPEYEVFEFFQKKTKYCIGIPVINEGKKIKMQIEGMKRYSKMVDILIFDGGSTDGSVNLGFLKKMSIRALIISSSGQGRQLRAGLAFALGQGYEGVITVDGNGKDDISAIPEFIKALDQGYDFVQGSRFLAGGYYKNNPIDRLLIARLIISPILSIAAGYWYSDAPNAFRGYSRRYLLHPGVQPFRNEFIRYELLFYLTIRANRLKLKTKEIPVTRTYPKGQIPTKIVGFKKIIDLLNIFKIALGVYNP